MINIIRCLERCEPVVKRLSPMAKSSERCSWADRGKGMAVDSIENEGAGAFEGGEVSEVNLVWIILLNQFEGDWFCFGLAGRSKHRIEYMGLVFVSGEPVVGEMGVGSLWFVRIWDYLNSDSMCD